MMIKEIKAKSILIKHKKIDSWFMTHYGMNLYRGCEHNCSYCDGRSERYNVDGDFGKEVIVKINAIELLKKALDPSKKKKPLPKSFIMVGGGVCDTYQPAEKKYKLTRQSLKIIKDYGYPTHILTKSTLVKRDIDILSKINKQNKVLISFSFSSLDDSLSKLFEPGVPSPSKRLDTIKRLKDKGFYCGMYLMPVIPFITDSAEMIEESIKKAKDAGVDFVMFATMTLKGGRQKEYFLKTLKKYYPKLLLDYGLIYKENNRWGEASRSYTYPVHEVFDNIATLYKVPKRIPPYIYKDIISTDDLVIVILEHLDYLLKLKGKKNPYGYAAYNLSRLNRDIGDIGFKELQEIKGIGPVTAKIIKEILSTGTSRYYESIL